MQIFALFAILLVASVSAAPQQVTNEQSVQQQPPSSPVVEAPPAVTNVAVEPQQAGQVQPPHHHVHPVHQHHHDHHDHHDHDQHHHHHEVPPQVSYYSQPAGMVTVLGANDKVPQHSGVRSYEQYGQPEPASLPPNYKPFGSWGLYIGGSPDDGYYTNYYKALSNSVDKQQVGEPASVPQVVPPSSASPNSGVYQSAGVQPSVRQATAYSDSDFRNHYRYGSSGVVPSTPLVYSSSLPGSFDSSAYGVSSYADQYATKKLGAAYAQKEVKETPLSKGYQSRVYVYPPVGAAAAPVVGQTSQVVSPQQQQQHIVAYPVPVGSQIVGSQPGVEGAFNPYGIHAFTRYAVKPTVVQSVPNPVYSSVVPLPAYKQQVYSGQQSTQYYPLSYYGYPVSQLHYSQGSIVPAHQAEGQPLVPQPSVEGVGSEKVETEDKSVNKAQQQQKKA